MRNLRLTAEGMVLSAALDFLEEFVRPVTPGRILQSKILALTVVCWSPRASEMPLGHFWCDTFTKMELHLHVYPETVLIV